MLGKLGTATALTATALTATAVTTVALAPPALAAYPESSYSASYGASTLRGKTIWYNRSNVFGATMKAVSGCRTAGYQTMTSYYGFLGFDSRTICNRTLGHSVTVPANVPGGAQRAFVGFGPSGQDPARVIECVRTNSGCWLISSTSANNAEKSDPARAEMIKKFVRQFRASR